MSLFDTNHLIETSQTKECSTCLKDFNIVWVYSIFPLIFAFRRMDWSSFEENIFSCASTTGRVMVYDINSTRNVIADYNEHESRVFCVALSKQNPKLLLSAGHDGMVSKYFTIICTMPKFFYKVKVCCLFCGGETFRTVIDIN